eukprot:TRINITY_DN1719_c0_g1_i1.p1 TRINITY_DN1719_c0_g1~~TRINITY_DN1719_c0_g1_i1.p1  ORF type:complete len:458 (+),score=135.84 TRINITY_DN1719_c0_g1_i1:28-1374(+)
MANQKAKKTKAKSNKGGNKPKGPSQQPKTVTKVVDTCEAVPLTNEEIELLNAAPISYMGASSMQPTEFSDVFSTPIMNEYNLTEYPMGPTTPFDNQYSEVPHGIFEEYAGSTSTRRTAAEEIEFLKRMSPETLNAFRKGGVVHRETRRFAQKIVKPGMEASKVVDLIDACNRRLIGYDKANPKAAGLSFPCGISINEVAAHWQPNPGDKYVFQQKDVVSVDFGLHVNGWVIDSAFTVAWDAQFAPLLQASREATLTAVKEAGIDVRLGELGKIIQEIIESYEVEIDGKVRAVKPIYNLSGHSVGQYKVHCGKSIPLKANSSKAKMEEGDIFALETFASTGTGWVEEAPNTSHFMIADKTAFSRVPSNSRTFFNHLFDNFDTLAWCNRWLVQNGQKGYFGDMLRLKKNEVVNYYPPLVDQDPTAHVAQYEHTFALTPNGKEIFTMDDDF